MNKKIYFSPSENFKFISIAQSMELLCEDSHWIENNMPLFDLLEIRKPDIVVLADDFYSTEHIQYAKQEYPNVKFVLCGKNNHPVFDLFIDLDQTPYLANRVFSGGKHSDAYETDILFISDNFSMQNNAEEHIKILFSACKDYRLKIYGVNNVRVPNYLGMLPANEYKNAIASAKIVMMFDHQWLNTVLLNKRIPLVFNAKENTDVVFSSYTHLKTILDKHLNKKEITYIDYKENLETYDIVCNKILEIA